MFKSKTNILIIFALLFAITGCGQNNVSPPPPETGDTNNTTPGITEGEINPLDDDDDMTVRDEDIQHSFMKFDLDVEYDRNVSYEAEYEMEGNGEAKIEDDLNDRRLYGDEAYNELKPKLEQLNFTQETENIEITEEILTVFGIPAEYKEFELEVTFTDGTTKEVKFTQ